MTTMRGPPMETPPTSMTVSSSLTSRETSLKGWETRMASRTPGRLSKIDGSSPPLLPVIPMAVRWAPGMTWGRSPRERIFSTTASTWASVALGFITTSMLGPASSKGGARIHPATPRTNNPDAPGIPGFLRRRDAL